MSPDWWKETAPPPCDSQTCLLHKEKKIKKPGGDLREGIERERGSKALQVPPAGEVGR